MLVAQDSNSNARAVKAAPTVVHQHEKRPEWGLAALVWERDGKRGYRFEDGSERTFQEGYYHLLVPRPAVGDAAEKLLASVRRERAQRTSAGAAGSAVAAAPRVPAPTLGQLVAVLHELFPKGFGDPKWLLHRRGDAAPRRAKRHRAPALAEAATRLGREALDELLTQGNAVEVLRRAHEVLAATDLVTATQLHPLARATPSLTLARAIRDLLHEPDPEGVCFDRAAAQLVRASGRPPAWPLLTGLRALVRPQHDVCIRPSVFFDAVQVVAPHRARKAAPQGAAYEGLAAVARELLGQLRAAGEAPADLLDVHDFIWETCRPSAAPLLERVRLRGTEPALTPPETTEADEEDQAEAA